MEEKNNLNVPQTTTVNNFAVPFAIIIAGLAIAGAVYFGDGGKGATGIQQGAKKIVLEPVTSTDHILGSPKAKITIVEYSDLECLFCKKFHPTMTRIMDEYGESGKVAWVYRHYPLPSHPKAIKQAEATECVAKLGKDKAFWEYTNKIFEVTPSGNGLDMSLLPKLAKEMGIDEVAFNTCLESGEMRSIVDAGIASGTKAGVQGTPHSLIVVNNKVVGTIGGAQPYEAIKAQIEELLK